MIVNVEPIDRKRTPNSHKNSPWLEGLKRKEMCVSEFRMYLYVYNGITQWLSTH